MVTILVCHESPFPPTSGSPLRMWQQLNILAKRGPVHVFSLGDRPANLDQMPIAASWLHISPDEINVKHWPGALRILRAIMPPQHHGTFGDFADAMINRRLEQFIKKIAPTHVVLSHWHSAMPRPLRNKRRKFKLILDSHNIEWALENDRRREFGLIARIRNWGYRRREKALFSLADISWVTSDKDNASARALAPTASRIVTWPNAVDITTIDRRLTQILETPSQLKHQWPTITFVGFLAYPPNEEAAMISITKIFPRIKMAYTDARLFIVGKDPKPIITATAALQKDVTITGTVPDVLPYLAITDIVVVPLTVGGGTRLKILEALAALVPVVSTSKGAEGIATAGSREVLVEDDLDAMAVRILEILDSQSTRQAQINAGRTLVEQKYSWDALTSRLDDAL